ncbi:hypothetical protein N7512_002656 [Penicillium capsulatum]|nr:hypothetical protein N7512_002656 [Penicillium capsulatum]
MHFPPILVSCLATLAYLGTFAQSSRIPLPSWTGCPVDGPLLPRPTDLAGSKYVQDATTNLTRALDSALKGQIQAGFEVDNTSFSISFVSPFHSTSSRQNDSILWSYHHLGKNNVDGTKSIDEDSQYLIGSVSKVFSDLLLLQSDVDLNDPITKYLPGLDSKENTTIQWSNITLSALSNHMAGIPANLPSSFEIYSLRSVMQKLGFPLVANSSYPNCGVTGLNHACDEEQIIEMMNTALPVQQPYSQTVYSSLSFILFALALGNHANKTYEQLLDEGITAPPRAEEYWSQDQGWGTEYGLNAPGGGLYSSLRDLSTLTAKILDYSILSTPEKTRQWLKPQSVTSSVKNLVGRPWEIQRTENLVPENPHTVDIYAKSGGASGYIAQLSVVDQYGAGFVILTAGPRGEATAWILNDAVISSLIPAIDRETREQARRYTGNFSVSATEDQKSAVALSLSIDHGTGVKVNSLTRNGADILAGVQKLWDEMLPQTGILNTDFRIYPTDIVHEVEGEKDVVLEDWRINFDMVPSDNAAMSDLPGQGKLSADICASWQTGSWLYYGGQSLDRIVFKVDRKAGRVIGVEVPFLRSGLLAKSY